MSEGSRRGRVTITLGRSGQVGNRAGSELDELPKVGTKRSVKERLGNPLDRSFYRNDEVASKRQRREADFSDNNDPQMDKEYRRLKLMKVVDNQRQSQSDACGALHLRENFSQDRTMDKNDLRFKLKKAAAVRLSQSDFGGALHIFENFSMCELCPPLAERSHVPLPSVRISSSPRDLSAPRNAVRIRRTPRRSTRSFSSRSLALSPARNVGRYRSSSLAYPSPRNHGLFIGSPLRSSNIEDFQGRTRNLDDVEDPQPVDDFLRSIGLERYSPNFKREEVDMTTIKQLSETDLKDLSIPMGPRKLILQAIESLPEE